MQLMLLLLRFAMPMLPGSMSKLSVLNALGGMARGRSRSSSRRR